MATPVCTHDHCTVSDWHCEHDDLSDEQETDVNTAHLSQVSDNTGPIWAFVPPHLTRLSP